MKKIIRFLKNEALIVFIITVLFYFNTTAVTSPSDTIPNLFLPVNLIWGRGFYLDELYPFLIKVAPVGEVEGLVYYLSYQKEHYLSDYPVMTAVLAVPIYLPLVLVKGITIENIYETYRLIPVLGKLSGAILTALSVSFLYLALRLLTEKNKALLLTAIYAFGTSSFSISSQALWQHGASQMFLALSIFLLVKGQREKKFLGLAGLPLGLATATRYMNVIPSLIIFAYIFFFQKKQLLRFTAFLLPALIFLFAYNWFYLGSPLSAGYRGPDKEFSHSLLPGIAGLLFATSKGLFVYSPVFLFSFWGILKSWVNKKETLLKIFSLIFVAFTLMMAKWEHWHGGWSFGPRMLVDMTPFLVMLLVPVVNSKLFKKPVVFLLFYVLTVISILIQFLGVTLAYDLSWYRDYLSRTEGLAHLWSFKDGELLYYFRKAGGAMGILSALANELARIISRVLRLGLVMGIFYFVLFSFRTEEPVAQKRQRKK